MMKNLEAITIATFYKFVPLSDLEQLQEELLSWCQHDEIKGTILLAQEGINSTIAGSATAIESIINHLRSLPYFQDLEVKTTTTHHPPFKRLKVRLKKEIVTLGMPEVNPNEAVGTYVAPQDWNELIQDPNVILIDTRNEYEVNIGTFKQAINPHTESFREFPDYVENHLDPTQQPKVAMFCTGGIRCEKATSFLKRQGFGEVYHLQGGILKYLEEIPPEESLWEGECFVFDERVAVTHGLEEGHYQLCYHCGSPIPKTAEEAEKVSCPYCHSHSPLSLDENRG